MVADLPRRGLDTSDITRTPDTWDTGKFFKMESSHQWRPVIAVLANPETRRVAAELMLGRTLEDATAELSRSKRRRVTEAIENSGMVLPGTQMFAPGVFRSILESNPIPQRVGVERFVDGKRIRQYPANLEERGQLLAWVARSVFATGDVLTEREVNRRLLEYSEDVAVLRRYLVDYQLLERRSDGTEYALTGSGPVLTLEDPQETTDPDRRP
ncbi:DUF2087 domain-containing protein [Microbacterium sp. SSW1-49]|uniref:DUF2087 domain-containing protein n=1 Tax=Microbacterium croceum TaxID=2851645 RepID=A0ABT0FG74_9MICO|nr:DUF2087 domain-containing protein [Microbacterium croceum]MCK2037070.1 DUF2087 domain-containing protein [Microbacterium croceum]